LLVYLIIYR